MELKHTPSYFILAPVFLLIVPYGIETFKCLVICQICRILLIVPYGIETWYRGGIGERACLLIVPYGIET